jgi:ribosomal protein S18 acetylase RimI-like enzyme
MRAELDRGLWRPLTSAEVPAVCAIADQVHLSYPEDDDVFAERQRLYPAGCAMLEYDGAPMGYAVTHPWHYGQPPALNVMLGALPDQPSTYYIHDIATLPETRGSGAGSAIVKAVLAHARETGLGNVSLVAVNSSVPFWSRFGFDVVSDPALDAKLRSYDDAARFMVLRF